MTPISTPAISERPDQRGFTLVELALVLLIVGVMVTIAVPRLPSLTAVRLQTEAEHLATRIAYLTDEAALRGRVYRMRLDLDAESYDTAALLPYAASENARVLEPTWDPFTKPVALDDTLDIEGLVTSEGEWREGEHALYFFPEGDGAGAAITLARADGSERVQVRLEEGTGEVRVLGETDLLEESP